MKVVKEETSEIKENSTMTPEEVEKENLRVIREFLADPSTRDYAIKLAWQLKNAFGDVWFSSTAIIKKVKTTKADVEKKIIILKHFKLLAVKESKDKILYRIDLTHKVQREQYSREIEEHEKAMKQLQAQILILKEKFAALD